MDLSRILDNITNTHDYSSNHTSRIPSNKMHFKTTRLETIILCNYNKSSICKTVPEYTSKLKYEDSQEKIFCNGSVVVPDISKFER